MRGCWHNRRVPDSVGENLPFRWDLITPDQLGSLLASVEKPKLWFLDELVGCAGKVVARGGDGDLVFVGRSLDSMYDLLGGVLADTAAHARLSRLPLSFARPWGGPGLWSGRRPLTPAEVKRARQLLTAAGVTPATLSQRSRPLAFVDVVHEGGTFTELFGLLSDWIADERESWDVIRRKLRFIGVTPRRKTSPNAYRWQQHADWTGRLPSRSVVNVSLDPNVWSYFGDRQTKLTRSYRPDLWLTDANGPGRDEATRKALAEAVAVVAYGRSTDGRKALARAMAGEPSLAEPWLRSLVTRLNA